MSFEREPHMINGKRVGTLYQIDGEYKMYLLLAKGEKTRLFDHQNSAWRMPTLSLHNAKSNNCEYIGVAHRIGKKFSFYITKAVDWYGPMSSSSSFKGESYRSLKLSGFNFNSTHTKNHISKSIVIK